MEKLEQELQNKNRAFLDNDIYRPKGQMMIVRGIESALWEALDRNFVTGAETWAVKTFFKDWKTSGIGDGEDTEVSSVLLYLE